jgi:hypothetical protein
MRLDTFKRHHQELIQLVEEITILLNPQQLDPQQLDLLITILKYKLKNYFETLGAEYLKSSNPKIQNFAKINLKQVNLITKACNNYYQNWHSHLQIENNPAGFCFDTRELLSVIKAKVVLDIQKLHPIRR